MNVQYISNQEGQRTAVIVPIGEWEKIQKRLQPRQKKTADKPATKEQILADVKEALEEVKLSKEGKIQLKSAWDLLNEL